MISRQKFKDISNCAYYFQHTELLNSKLITCVIMTVLVIPVYWLSDCITHNELPHIYIFRFLVVVHVLWNLISAIGKSKTVHPLCDLLDTGWQVDFCVHSSPTSGNVEDLYKYYPGCLKLCKTLLTLETLVF